MIWKKKPIESDIAALNSKMTDKLGSFGLYEDSNKTVNDLPSTYNIGITFTVTGGSTTFPYTYGSVMTIKIVGRTMQYNYAGNGGIKFRQSNSESSWGDWKTVTTS